MNIDSRISKACRTFYRLNRSVWKRPQVSLKTKMRIYRSAVIELLLYGSNSWTVKKDTLDRLEKFNMSCLRQITGFTMWDRKRNEFIRKTADQPKIATILRSRRLQWLGHVARYDDNRTTKKVLFGKLFGKRPKSKNRKCLRNLYAQDISEIGFNHKGTDWYKTAQDRQAWKEKRHDCKKKEMKKDFSKPTCTKPRTVPCPFCQDKFVHSGALNTHIHSKHPQSGDLATCPLCLRSFNSRGFPTHYAACRRNLSSTHATITSITHSDNKINQRIPCPTCGTMFHPKGLGRHRKACDNKDHKHATNQLR